MYTSRTICSLIPNSRRPPRCSHGRRRSSPGSKNSLIFNGKEPGAAQIVGTEDLQSVFEVGGADSYRGLVYYGRQHRPVRRCRLPIRTPTNAGPAVFTAVVEAIGRLERQGHYKSYALVLATDLFTAINKPIPNSMVLPADSMPALLDGPLLRSSSLGNGQGLVISLQGNPAEIVVASDISVRYLQGTLDGLHAFRVSERFVLRVKEPTAIVLIESGTQTGTGTHTGSRTGTQETKRRLTRQVSAGDGRIYGKRADATLGRAGSGRERAAAARPGGCRRGPSGASV